MTTSEPSLAQEIYAAAKDKGICTLDAPGRIVVIQIMISVWR